MTNWSRGSQAAQESEMDRDSGLEYQKISSILITQPVAKKKVDAILCQLSVDLAIARRRFLVFLANGGLAGKGTADSSSSPMVSSIYRYSYRSLWPKCQNGSANLTKFAPWVSIEAQR